MNKIKFIIFSSGAGILSKVLEENKKELMILEINPLIDSKLTRALRSISLKTGVFKSYWFYKQINKHLIQISNKAEDYKVIVFDSPLWIVNGKEFLKEFELSRIKFWFWNPIKTKNQIMNLSEVITDIYSFDPNDCKKYKLKFIPQFYIPTIETDSNEISENHEYDLSFVGRAKKRLKEIEIFYKQISRTDLKPFFYIKKDKYFQNSRVIDLKKNFISLKDYAIIQKKSKVIVEFISKEQSGLSLRALEALFTNKKLITNNPLIGEYDFYFKENILIWKRGKTTTEAIIEFIKTPTVEIKESTKNKFSFKSWLENF